jgi:6-phosphogluconolactonase
MQVCRWHIYPDEKSLQARVTQIIVRMANAAIGERGAFHIVLAGGNTPKAIYAQLRKARTQWRAWHIYFGDERCLPSSHPDRNSTMAASAWLKRVAIPQKQIHAIPSECGALEAARAYGAVLRGMREFDLVLLGLGEDGHTASLFPGHPLGNEPGQPAVLAVSQAPKPPMERVSLSARRLASAKEVIFLVTGASKSSAMERWRAGESIPAAHIEPKGGVDVCVDRAAWG